MPDLANGGGSDVTVADFTGDGVPDIVVANASDPAVLLPGRGEGAFGTPVDIPGQFGSLVVAGDWNNDGKQDLAFGQTIYQNSGIENLRIASLLGHATGPRSKQACGDELADGIHLQ